MKKLLLFGSAVLLCCTFATGQAQEEIKVTQKNYYTFSEYSTYGYLFAKVENTGDVPVYLDSGKLVIFDENDDIVETAQFVQTYPDYLLPGEYGYAYDWALLDDDVQVADYKFSVGSSEYGTEVKRLECEAFYDAGESSKYDDYMYITVTNTTDKPLYDLYVVASMLDKEGNILYTNYDVLNEAGVHSNSTVTFRLSVNDSFAEQFAAQGTTPDRVDAIVYFEEE